MCLFLIYVLLFVLFMLIGTSYQASYYRMVNAGPIDYNSGITKAEEAGYYLSGPYTRLDEANLIELGNIESL